MSAPQPQSISDSESQPFASPVADAAVPAASVLPPLLPIIEVEVCAPIPVLKKFAQQPAVRIPNLERRERLLEKEYRYYRLDIATARQLIRRFNTFAVVESRTMALARFVQPLDSPVEVWRPPRPAATATSRPAWPELPPLPANWPAAFVGEVAGYARAYALRPGRGAPDRTSLWIDAGSDHAEAQVRALAAGHGLCAAGGRAPTTASWSLRATGPVERWGEARAGFMHVIEDVYGEAALIPSERGRLLTVTATALFEEFDNALADEYHGHAVVRPAFLRESDGDNPWQAARRSRLRAHVEASSSAVVE